jgi:uncharacterized protein YceH (UPF0502 family)
MPKNSYAEQISQAQVMLAGLERHADQVAQRGLTKIFVSQLSDNTTGAIALNNEQEKLKADLKAKTAQLEAKLAEINQAMAEARKIVKLDFPQSQWKEFGIDSKR